MARPRTLTDSDPFTSCDPLNGQIPSNEIDGGKQIMSLKLDNPDEVAAPLGLYSHSVEVPAGAGLIFLSGQVPVRADGYTGASLAEQADQVYANIVQVLSAKGCKPDSIIKLTTYFVEDDAEGVVRQARLKHLGDHRPASTAVYVSRLVEPEWKIEIDAVAMAPAPAVKGG